MKTGMTVIVKNSTADLVVPSSIRRRAGLKAGDQVEFKVSGGIINIIPKLPDADEEDCLWRDGGKCIPRIARHKNGLDLRTQALDEQGQGLAAHLR